MSAPKKRGPAVLVIAAGLLLTAPLVWVLASGFGNDPHYIASPLIDKLAPDFELPDVDTGDLVKRASLEGKPTVINFWATWCQSCPMEHPDLVRAARQWGDQVQFVGIAYNDRNEAIKGWLRRNGGAAFPTLVDVNGKAAIAYGVYGVPETYVLDKEGVVRFKHTGPINPRALYRQLEGLL